MYLLYPLFSKKQTKKNCISPAICQNTLTKAHLIMFFFLILLIWWQNIKRWIHGSPAHTLVLTRGPMCSSDRYMTEPRWAWVSALVTGSERGWFTVLQQESLTHDITVIFTAQPDTQRNLEIWLVGTSFLHSIFRKTWTGGALLIHRKQSCHTEGTDSCRSICNFDTTHVNYMSIPTV